MCVWQGQEERRALCISTEYKEEAEHAQNRLGAQETPNSCGRRRVGVVEGEGGEDKGKQKCRKAHFASFC